MEQNAKYFLYVAFLIFNRIIFRFDGFQLRHQPFISAIHMPVLINQTLRTLFLKYTMVSSSLFSKFSFDTVVINSLPATLKNLKKTHFFPVIYSSCHWWLQNETWKHNPSTTTYPPTSTHKIPPLTLSSRQQDCCSLFISSYLSSYLHFMQQLPFWHNYYLQPI